MLQVEVQGPVVVLDVIGALAPAADEAVLALFTGGVIEGDVGREGEGDAPGQLAQALIILGEAGHDPGLPLGGGVQGDVQELMVNVGVIEPVDDGAGELGELVFRQVQGGDDLVEDGLIHEVADGGVLHALADDVLAGQVGTQHHGGMGTVEDADLALLVGGVVVHHDDGQAGLLEGELVLDPLGALDDPEAEDLGGVDDVILVAQLPADGLGLLAGIAGDDAVHQGGAEHVLPIHPGGEVILQAPELDILLDAALQLVAVMVDELAGQDDKALQALLPAPVQEHGELAGEAGRRRIVKLAGGVEDDAGLGGVGHQEAEVGILGLIQQTLEVLIGVIAALDAGDDTLAVHLLAILAAPEEQGVQALLGVDHGSKARGDGLGQHHLAVEAGLLVHHVDEIIHESAEEVALAELQHLHRGLGQQVTIIALVAQGLVA